MAAATTIIAAGLAVGGGALKAYQGGKQKRDFNNKIGGYERQELNDLADNLTLSTYGSDLIRDESARNTATMMGAVQQGGSRTIAGSVGRISAMGAKANEAGARDLDEQDRYRKYAHLREGQTIRGMQEGRENQDLAGMGSMALAGQQTEHGGYGDMMQGALYGMRQDENEDGVNGFGKSKKSKV